MNREAQREERAQRLATLDMQYKKDIENAIFRVEKEEVQERYLEQRKAINEEYQSIIGGTSYSDRLNRKIERAERREEMTDKNIKIYERICQNSVDGKTKTIKKSEKQNLHVGKLRGGKVLIAGIITVVVTAASVPAINVAKNPAILSENPVVQNLQKKKQINSDFEAAVKEYDVSQKLEDKNFKDLNGYIGTKDENELSKLAGIDLVMLKIYKRSLAAEYLEFMGVPGSDWEERSNNFANSQGSPDWKTYEKETKENFAIEYRAEQNTIAKGNTQ